jgi:hypothetical protein
MCNVLHILAIFEEEMLQAIAVLNPVFVACLLTEVPSGEASIDIARVLTMQTGWPPFRPLPAETVSSSWESVSRGITMTGSAAEDAEMLCPNILLEYIPHTKIWMSVYPVAPVWMILAMFKERPTVEDVLHHFFSNPLFNRMFSHACSATSAEGATSGPYIP